MFSLYFTALKFSCEGNQPLFTDLGPNTGTASNYDVLIFCDFRKMIGGRIGDMGGFFLYGIYRARFNYDVSHYKFVRQCFIFLFLTKIPEKYRRNSRGASSNSCDYLGICDWGVGRSILVGALVTIISLFFCAIARCFLADGHHDFIDDSDSFL